MDPSCTWPLRPARLSVRVPAQQVLPGRPARSERSSAAGCPQDLADKNNFIAKKQVWGCLDYHKSSVADPCHFGVDPDPRIHASD